MTVLGPIRFKQDGFPDNWKESISSLLRKTAPVNWNVILMNERTSWKAHYHRRWNLDSSIQPWEQTTEHAVKTHNFCFQEILIMAFTSQDYANSVLGFQRPSMSTSTAQIWEHSNKSWIFWHCNLPFTINTVEDIQSVLLLHATACPHTAAHTTTILQI